MFCRPYDDKNAYEVILDSVHEVNSTNARQIGNTVTVLNLHPKSRYLFWMQFWFENRLDVYDWPENERFVFETNTDRPSAPGTPSIIIRSNEVQVTWSPADGNGAPIEEYILEGLRKRVLNRALRSTNSNQANTVLDLRQTVNESEPIVDSWTVYYKGNETFWIVKGLTDISMYSFRVRARNANGYGEYSKLSEQTTGIPALSTDSGHLVIAVAAPALVAILVITFSCFVCGEFF